MENILEGYYVTLTTPAFGVTHQFSPDYFKKINDFLFLREYISEPQLSNFTSVKGIKSVLYIHLSTHLSTECFFHLCLKTTLIGSSYPETLSAGEVDIAN